MAQDKISVSWDDLNSRKVESRLKEQDALTRTRQYAQMDESSLPIDGALGVEPSPLVRLWRNSVFSMALFGLIGGLLAWGLGALVQVRDTGNDAANRMRDINRIAELREQGVLTEEQAKAATDRELARGHQENGYFAVMSDRSLSDTEAEQRLSRLAARDKLKLFIGHILEYGIAGVMVGLFLAIATPVTERNLPGVVVNGAVGAALGLVGGVVVSLFFDRVYLAVMGAGAAGGQATTLRELLARVAAWGTLGLFLTVGPGVVMRNWRKFFIGLLGGLIGGLVGGILYGPVAAWANNRPNMEPLHLEKLVAMAAIGLFAGLATGAIENAAKSGWVRVTAGLIAGKQFILYRNPTYVGSGPDCQIYLFKDPKVGRRHAAFHIVPGGFELEDLPLGIPTMVNGKVVKRARLKNGDRVQIGSTQLLFQEKVPAA